MGLKVAMYKGHTRIFNKLVRWWCRGDYSHTELVTGGQKGAWVCWSSSFLDGGVRQKTMALDPEHWDVYELPEGFSVETAVQWFVDHDHCKYDVMGLVGFVVRRVADARNRYFCNEAVGASIGLGESWRFDPCSFACLVKMIGTEVTDF